MAESDTDGIGIVIELKYAADGDLDAACLAALDQIKQKRYDEQLIDDGMETILKYGIACYKKIPDKYSCTVSIVLSSATGPITIS